MRMQTKVAMWGGPEDGGERLFEGVLIPGHYDATGHTFVEHDADGEVQRVGTFMYHYHLTRQSSLYGWRLVYVFSHDWIQEGGEDVGLKKFGTGKIIETETEQQDLSKTASQGWSAQDQAELDEENGEG